MHRIETELVVKTLFDELDALAAHRPRQQDAMEVLRLLAEDNLAIIDSKMPVASDGVALSWEAIVKVIFAALRIAATGRPFLRFALLIAEFLVKRILFQKAKMALAQHNIEIME